jgi:hypothetical protein
LVPAAVSSKVKRQGRDADHWPLSRGEVKKVELYLHSPVRVHDVPPQYPVSNKCRNSNTEDLGMLLASISFPMFRRNVLPPSSGWNVNLTRNILFVFLFPSVVFDHKMEAVCSSKSSVSIYQTARRHIGVTYVRTLHSKLREKIKSNRLNNNFWGN